MNDIRIPKLRSRKPKASVDVEPDHSDSKTFDVLIVGAGFSGLGAAIRLQQAGVTNVVIVERGDDIGGTWRDNQYPGAACDIPSNLYSYSFAQNPSWSRGYSGAKEIQAYIQSVADRFKLRGQIRLNHNVVSMTFDESDGAWNVHTENHGVLRARSVVMAQGPLSNASLPNIRGIETFEGKKIHSARWDHDYDLSGKRVAVIGTGASSIQIVPELVKVAGKVKVFQRTPPYVMPRLDYESREWNRWLFRKFPMTQSAYRSATYWLQESMALGVVWTTPATRLFESLSLAYMRSQVKDKWLRRQVTPDYRLGCKRILVTNDWYPALQQPNCQLITWPIANISEKGIRTVEGIEHQFDCIVFATGFDVSKSGAPFPVTGVGGRQLAEDWERGASAYKSVSVSGYPNLFLSFGPNSGAGHNSAFAYMEPQFHYITQAVTHLLRKNLKSLDVRPDVQSRHNAQLQKRLKRTNWNSGCSSWYLTEDGYNSTMYPGLATQYRAQMRKFRPEDYWARKA